jgi:uncharacterized protein (TIGR02145 family)
MKISIFTKRGKMKKVASLLLFSIVAFAQQKGSFIDSRDGKKYKTIEIGTQTWMAENLNYNTKGSKCCSNKSANCNKYGRLYNWETAMKVCPKGWHLPNNEEWYVLKVFIGDEAGTKLKTISGWNIDDDYIPGTDDYGFSALPGGEGYSDGSFNDGGYHGSWWSATESNKVAYHHDIICCKKNIGYGFCNKDLLKSVRCVIGDEGPSPEGHGD